MNKKQPLLPVSPINFSVIIPNYNGASLLPDCLNSLIKAIKNSSNSKFELVFVDNGSVDDSLLIIKKFENSLKIVNCSLKIIKNNTNYGFAKAVNRGINKAKYPYVAILNNDLTMESNWFKIISKTISKNSDTKISTFFGTVLNKDGSKFESQGLDFKIEGKCLNISNGLVFHKSKILNLKSSIVWGASASLVVYQKDVIQKIGLFDEDFFAYEEDVDLSFRLNRLGYKTLYIPKAISYHLGGATSNKMGNFRAKMDTKNWLLLIIKNYSTQEFWTNIVSIKIERLRNLVYLSKTTIKKYKFIAIYKLPYDLLKTYCQVIIKIPKMFKKRHQFQKLLKST